MEQLLGGSGLLLTGVLPVLPTAFDHAGAIDRVAMAHVVDFVLRAGAHGAVFPGVASEFDHLSADERRALIETVGQGLGGRIPFIVGASGPTAADVIAYCAMGRAAGAVAAMVMAPASLGSDVAALTAFFSEIAASGLDIILQNAPAPVGSGLSVQTMLEVVAAVPGIAYIKEETLPSGPKITQLIERAPAHLKGVIGGGGARYVFDELERGAIALMPAAEITDLHVALFNDFQGGNRGRAREAYIRSLPLLLVQMIYRMELTKQALIRRGVLGHAVVRAPLPKFDARGLAEIDTMLAEIEDLLTIPLPSRVAEIAK
jgi:dihydrodipicolinate synthase/N-acetylneuraminate lyase